jgi:hypothetical protein
MDMKLRRRPTCTIVIVAILVIVLFHVGCVAAENLPRKFKFKFDASITNRSEILLEPGVNDVSFAAFPQKIRILKAQYALRPTLFNNYCVIAGGEHGGWTGVPIGDEFCILDYLGDDDAAITSIRFFNAELDGKPAALLFAVFRDIQTVAEARDYASATIAMYKLTADADDPSRLAFEEVDRIQTHGKYASADDVPIDGDDPPGGN